MYQRYAGLVFLWVLAASGWATAHAQGHADWSAAVVIDLRDMQYPADPDVLTARFQKGMTLLLHRDGLTPARFETFQKAIQREGLRVIDALPGDAADTSVVLMDLPMELTGDSSGADAWDDAYRTMAAAASPQVLRLSPEALEPRTLYRALLAPTGLLLPDEPLDSLARIVLSFRLRHPAVGSGLHERLVNSAYAMHRSFRTPGAADDVIIVFDADGSTTINVSRPFEDDTLLRDAATGRTAFVSFGMARFDAHESGLMLIEAAP